MKIFIQKKAATISEFNNPIKIINNQNNSYLDIIAKKIHFLKIKNRQL